MRTDSSAPERRKERAFDPLRRSCEAESNDAKHAIPEKRKQRAFHAVRRSCGPRSKTSRQSARGTHDEATNNSSGSGGKAFVNVPEPQDEEHGHSLHQQPESLFLPESTPEHSVKWEDTEVELERDAENMSFDGFDTPTTNILFSRASSTQSGPTVTQSCETRSPTMLIVPAVSPSLHQLGSPLEFRSDDGIDIMDEVEECDRMEIEEDYNKAQKMTITEANDERSNPGESPIARSSVPQKRSREDGSCREQGMSKKFHYETRDNVSGSLDVALPESSYTTGVPRLDLRIASKHRRGISKQPRAAVKTSIEYDSSSQPVPRGERREMIRMEIGGAQSFWDHPPAHGAEVRAVVKSKGLERTAINKEDKVAVRLKRKADIPIDVTKEGGKGRVAEEEKEDVREEMDRSGSGSSIWKFAVDDTGERNGRKLDGSQEATDNEEEEVVEEEIKVLAMKRKPEVDVSEEGMKGKDPEERPEGVGENLNPKERRGNIWNFPIDDRGSMDDEASNGEADVEHANHEDHNLELTTEEEAEGRMDPLAMKFANYRVQESVEKEMSIDMRVDRDAETTEDSTKRFRPRIQRYEAFERQQSIVDCGKCKSCGQLLEGRTLGGDSDTGDQVISPAVRMLSKSKQSRHRATAKSFTDERCSPEDGSGDTVKGSNKAEHKIYTPKRRPADDNEFKAEIRREIAYLFNTENPDIRVAAPQQVRCFANTNKAVDGPQLDDIFFDFDGPSPVTPWNIRIAHLLTKRYVAQPGVMVKDEVRVKKAFTQRLRKLHVSYQRSLRTLSSDEITAGEAKTRLVNQKTRQYYQRNRREKVALTLATKGPTMARHAQLWKTIPQEACSEDEEITYATGTRFEKRTPFWRNLDAQDFFAVWDHLDIAQRYGPDGKPKGKGRFPRYRHQPNPPRKNIDAPIAPGLPLNFYDPLWYSTLDEIEKEAVNARPPIDLTLPRGILRFGQRHAHIRTRDDRPLPA